MKALLIFLIACLAVLSPAVRAEDESVDDRYVTIYGLMLAGDAKAESGQAAAARAKYAEAQSMLKKLREDYPNWSVKVVKFRMDYLAEKAAGPSTESTSGSSAVAAPMTMATPANAGDPVEMRIKWEVGKRYLERVEMSQVMNMNMPGSAEPMKQEMKQSQDIGISALKERDGGGDELEMEFLSMTMDMKMGGTSLMSYDSKQGGQDNSGNPAAAILGKMVGSKIKFLTDPSGKVDAVEGYQEFQDRVMSGSPPEMQTMMKGLMSEDSLKQMSPSNMGLPGKPAKIGDTWPVKLEVGMGPMGRIVLNLNYTFTGWEQHDDHKCAVLEYVGDISMKPGGDESAAGTMSIDEGKASGKTWFDPAMGMIKETAGKQDMTMKINTQGQSIATQMHQDLDTKLVEVSDIAK